MNVLISPEVTERKLDGRNVRKQTAAEAAASRHESLTDLIVSVFWKAERQWVRP